MLRIALFISAILASLSLVSAFETSSRESLDRFYKNDGQKILSPVNITWSATGEVATGGLITLSLPEEAYIRFDPRGAGGIALGGTGSSSIRLRGVSDSMREIVFEVTGQINQRDILEIYNIPVIVYYRLVSEQYITVQIPGTSPKVFPLRLRVTDERQSQDLLAPNELTGATALFDGNQLTVNAKISPEVDISGYSFYFSDDSGKIVHEEFRSILPFIYTPRTNIASVRIVAVDIFTNKSAGITVPVVSTKKVFTDKDFQITSPVSSTLTTSDPAVSIEGRVTPGLVSVITINGMKLDKFPVGGENWLFVVGENPRFVSGKNTYLIEYFGEKNTPLYAQKIEIISTASGSESQDVAAAMIMKRTPLYSPIAVVLKQDVNKYVLSQVDRIASEAYYLNSAEARKVRTKREEIAATLKRIEATRAVGIRKILLRKLQTQIRELQALAKALS